jgi:hypothetical protein
MQAKLIRDWTDPQGVTHPAGSTIDVDAVTLAQLEAAGYLGPTGGGGTAATDYLGPTSEPK